ncbi:MAG: c-type cytochrome domain-containing protein, partial [Prosthecobacter sp.]|nr:c-type cytochrome domain-containing protein [Prosthecobacter sp.]
MRLSAVLLITTLTTGAIAAPAGLTPFLDSHCVECHDAEVKKGGLNLTALPWKLDDRESFDRWVKVFDRVRKGEMPPAKKPRPLATE